MSQKSDKLFRHLGLISALMLMFITAEAFARDAAFIDPGTSSAGANDDAIKVEPKGDIDTGESVLNVARHTTLFFINQTNQPVLVSKVTVNGDGNVTAEIINDDCSKQQTIPPLSRCSIEVSVTPTSPGPWSAEALLTHNGAGRIARAKLSGKTTGTAATAEKKDTGLSLSTKDTNPVAFGDVNVGEKAVRSALMENDSPQPITLYAIDVIEAGNGLERLEQGCAVDMELKPGESCPVTLVWTPTENGQISTDLIIRHSGRLGFAVIPIRGNAKGLQMTDKNAKMDMKADLKGSSGSVAIDNKNSYLPPPPSAQDFDRAAGGKLQSVSANALGLSAMPAPVPSGWLRLIGTVGNRAVLLKPDGTTVVVGIGEDFDLGDRHAKLTAITAKEAELLMDGKKKMLILGPAPELTSRSSSHSHDTADASQTSASVPGGASANGLGTPLGSSTLGATGTMTNTTTITPNPGTATAPSAIALPLAPLGGVH